MTYHKIQATVRTFVDPDRAAETDLLILIFAVCGQDEIAPIALLHIEGFVVNILSRYDLKIVAGDDVGALQAQVINHIRELLPLGVWDSRQWISPAHADATDILAVRCRATLANLKDLSKLCFVDPVVLVLHRDPLANFELHTSPLVAFSVAN